MKKTKIILLATILFLGYFYPITASAGLLKDMGQPCSSNGDSECLSGDCEESNVDYNRENLWFCDCSNDQQCVDTYGNAGEDWDCKNGGAGIAQSYGVDYCQKVGEPAIFPVTPALIRQGKQSYGAPALKEFGAYCTKDSECIYNQCETSDISELDFCTCDNDDNCVSEFGAGSKCINGTTESHNVNFCQKENAAPNYFVNDATIAAARIAKTANFSNTITGGLATDAENEPIKLTAPKLAVQIPGLKPWADQTSKPGETITVPYLVEYILALYRYGVVIGSIIAVVTFMIGGILYMTAGGIPSNVAKAQEVMIGSISGLALILCAYLMLNIINPNLVHLKPIKIETLQEEELDFSAAVTADHIGGGEQVQPDKPATTTTTKPSKPSGDSFVDESLLGQLDEISKQERPLSSIKYVVLHEGGNAQNIVNYWKAESAKGKYVSSHYSINKDGKIYQLLDESRVAWHAGSWNNASIGIDLEGTLPSTIFTEQCLQNCKAKAKYFTKCSDKASALAKCSMLRSNAQHEALLKLLKAIASRTSLVIDAQHVVSHCAISKPAQRADPRSLDWNQLGISTNAAYALNNGSVNCIFAPKHYDEAVRLADKIFGP